MKYNEYIDKVEEGYRFKIDLYQKKAYLKAPWERKYRLVEIEPLINPTSFDVCDQLYDVYKNSVYGKKPLNGNEPYFEIVELSDLTSMDIVNAEERNVAQAMLELYVMIANLKIDNNKYFWQSKKDKNFIILRELL